MRSMPAEAGYGNMETLLKLGIKHIGSASYVQYQPEYC